MYNTPKWTTKPITREPLLQLTWEQDQWKATAKEPPDDPLAVQKGHVTSRPSSSRPAD